MSRKRKSNGRFTAIGDVLAEILKGCRRKSGSDLSRVCRLWPGAVGSAIADNTRPVSMAGKQLTVAVSNSPWLHQLQFLKRQIIDGINGRAGEVIVEDIRFKIGAF